jgi:hypothetical protein
MRRTIAIALVVGTVLSLVNQGGHITSGDIDFAVALRIAANYLIPWIVSSTGYISARQASAASGREPPAPES